MFFNHAASNLLLTKLMLSPVWYVTNSVHNRFLQKSIPLFKIILKETILVTVWLKQQCIFQKTSLTLLTRLVQRSCLTWVSF